MWVDNCVIAAEGEEEQMWRHNTSQSSPETVLQLNNEDCISSPATWTVFWANCIAEQEEQSHQLMLQGGLTQNTQTLGLCMVQTKHLLRASCYSTFEKLDSFHWGMMFKVNLWVSPHQRQLGLGQRRRHIWSKFIRGINYRRQQACSGGIFWNNFLEY